jgi:diguanylate cyclase (GGDEF)-like protein
VLETAATRWQDLPAIEREQLGVTHIDAGTWMLACWKLPEEIWRTIAQTQPTATPTPETGRVPAARVLHAADVTAALLCDAREQRSGKAAEILQLMQECFDCDETGWTALYDQIVVEWKAYGQLLSVKAGTDKSFRDLQDEAREQIAALSMATQMENLGIKEQNQQLLQQTRIDALTNIANRAAFDERLAGELERARRTQCPLALCLLDIDHFKKFNDTYGHPVGDQVLQAVAKALDESIRKMDLAARYGGEEFAVIAPECHPAKAASLAERLREAVEEIQLRTGGQTLRVTTSVGVAFALWPGFERTAAELIKNADVQLYEAKRAGRNCCRLETTLAKQAA